MRGAADGPKISLVHRAPIDSHLQADDQMDAIPDNLWEDDL